MSAVEHTDGPWLISEEDLKQDPEVIFSIGIWSGSTNPFDDGSVMVASVSAFGLHSQFEGETEVVTPVAAEQREVDRAIANARLIAAAPTQHKEMQRYLPLLARAEADPELWAKLTEGLGIATLNGYRAAIAKAKGEAL